MENKLDLFLDWIALEEDEKPYFEGAVLNKIIGNKKADSYDFIISIEDVLPLKTYLNVQKKLSEVLLKKISVQAIFEARNYTFNNIAAYYRYFLTSYENDIPLVKMFADNPLNPHDHILEIEASNLAEKMKLESILTRLGSDLKKAGYQDLTLTVKVNSDANIEVQEEIARDLKVDLTNVKEVKKEVKEPKKHKEKDPSIIFGRQINSETISLSDVIGPMSGITIEGVLFADPEVRETKSDLKIITLKITDYTDSIYGKVFVNDEEEYHNLLASLKKNQWYKFRGNSKDDMYQKELVFSIYDIGLSDKKTLKREDLASEKRVELHAHTMMSQMDGVADAKELLKRAKSFGHKAIAITDHNGVQSFPDVYHTVVDFNKGITDEKDKFKAIYGTELVIIDDSVEIVKRPNDTELLKNTYVVFDLETTGFNAGGGDTIIEIGAVKLSGGKIIDRFDELINPGRPLPAKIVELTNITDEMLKDKDNEENAVKRFMEFALDFPLVAHNAKFDLSFLEMALQKYNLGSLTNPVIDTLELSRTLDTNFSRHSLSALVKRYNVPFDETAHHRGDYDAEGTALVFDKMMQKLVDRNLEKISDLDKLVSKDEIHKFGRSFHANILVKNKVGLKNLFKLVSLANTKYLYKTPRILRSEIEAHREGLLVGSGCYESEVFIEARSKSDEELTNIINFYDYVEVQPPECYIHLLELGDFASEQELLEHLKKIVRVTKESGKIIVATGDVHHIEPEDKIYRKIIVNQKVPGGGRHPLAKKEITDIPSNHLRTTDEMLKDFAFLGDDAYDVVVKNSNKIADMIDIVEVIIETGGVPFSPKIDKSVETVTDLVYTKASEWYGEPLPYNIEERISKELYGDGIFDAIKYRLGDATLDEVYKELHKTILKGFDAVKAEIRNYILALDNTLDEAEIEKRMKKNLGGIIGGGFDVIYLIAQKLVKHSNDDGYIVGSRGSVGSSFVATMMGITEVNPLPAHYRCPKCKYSIFEENGASLGSIYSSGFDLPDKDCPKCGTKMTKDGQDMPFATFLGFNADKVPDIDLNFSGEYQWKAHEYTKVLFGVDNVYRAGTIGTVADKTAFGFVKGYCEDNNITMRTAEVERLALGCTGVKRTTGQHPGGIVVIPGYMDVFDFTPFQYPADDNTSLWRTTHFDYHAIDQDVLKLDILGHDDPTVLRMLQDLSGLNIADIPLDDKETMDIFCSPAPLGVTKEEILCDTGTLGIPEFGTKFTIGMLVDTKPKTFAELIKISGLSHGTDVWLGNAQDLIRNNVVPFKNVIGCRDDIMVYLMYHGLEPIKAFKIMEFVRKGKASKDKETWQEHIKTMKEAGIEDWFIESCGKIKYMFPKAHAAAYVISAFRIAWFKVHHPIWYYAAYFSIRCADFDIDTMIKGYDAIKKRISEIDSKGFEASKKESAVVEVLRVALEASARGINFAPLELNNSDSTNFIIKDEHTLLPPFRTIDGLGDVAAKSIVEERNKNEFLSIEDLQKRGKLSLTLIDKMRLMGILDGLNESSQLSLF